MKGKVIWLFHHYADPPDGHWTNHYDLFEQMVRLGYQVTIFSSSFSHYSRRDDRLDNGEIFKIKEYNGVRFIFIKTTPYYKNNWKRYQNFFSYAVGAYRLALSFKEKPDIIIGSTPHPFCAFTGCLVAQRKSVPFFLEIHDLWVKFFVELGVYSDKSPIIWLLRWLDEYLYNKSKKIITLWPKMYLYIQQFNIKMDKIAWIPMGLKLDILENLKSIHSTGHSRGKNAFTVMYLGRFGLTQDIMNILNSAKIIQDKGLKNIQFVLIGGGPETDIVIKQMERLGITNIKIHDFLPKDKMFIYMKGADVLLGSLPDLPHFGKYGQISTKLLEYFLVSRPVIFATNSEDDIISRAGAGIKIPPNDPVAMSSAILSIAKMSSEERESMGKNGLKYVIENHDVVKLAKKLDSLIQYTA